MGALTIASIVTLIVIFIFLIIFIVYVVRLQKPSPGVNCKNTSPGWLWDSSCLYIQEKFLDSSLKSPANLSPYLIGFSYSDGAGNSIFLPCWYRFRYVNVLTGGYSEFSSWTQGPVVSGSCCLPCPGGSGKCISPQVPTGFDSCPSNEPVIGIAVNDAQYQPSQQQKDGSYIYINLHRYVASSSDDLSPPPDDVDDEIIGYLLAETYYGNDPYFAWIDVLDNPCKEGCNVPNWCYANIPCSSQMCVL